MKKEDLDRVLVQTFAQPMAALGFRFPKASRNAEFSLRVGDARRSIRFDAVKWPQSKSWDVRLRVSVRFEAIEQVLNDIDPDRRRASEATRRSVATVDTLTVNLTPPDLAFPAETEADIHAAVPRVIDHLGRVVPAFFAHFESIPALVDHLKSEQGHVYVSSRALVLPVALAVCNAPGEEVRNWVRRLTASAPGRPPRVFLARLNERFPHLGLDEKFLDSLPRPIG